MYIRVKRNKTTYFIQCEPTETVLDIKQKLHVLIDQPVNDQRLIIMNEGQTGQVLEDQKTLADEKVENDAVVALTLRKDDDEFEEVNIVRPMISTNPVRAMAAIGEVGNSPLPS